MRYFLWTLLSVLVSPLCLAQQYDRDAVDEAWKICVKQGAKDAHGCALDTVDRWSAMPADERKQVVRAQANEILKRCPAVRRTAFEACSLELAASMGERYVSPAMLLAKWDAEGEVYRKDAAARARAQAACKRSGFADGRLRIGATAAQVLDCSWGDPESKRRTTTSRGVIETWSYSNGATVLLFNGRVESFSESAQ